MTAIDGRALRHAGYAISQCGRKRIEEAFAGPRPSLVSTRPRRARKHSLVGKWRITGMELWDKDCLDMAEPVYIQLKANGLGEFKFGCVACGVDRDFSDHDAEFPFQGRDEMDEVSGRGRAELNDDGTLSGEIGSRLGDESTIKAQKW